eukprot:249768-Alexandrium_andersonii.AAC.1
MPLGLNRFVVLLRQFLGCYLLPKGLVEANDVVNALEPRHPDHIAELCRVIADLGGPRPHRGLIGHDPDGARTCQDRCGPGLE